jgi:hypothetical protein
MMDTPSSGFIMVPVKILIRFVAEKGTPGNVLTNWTVHSSPNVQEKESWEEAVARKPR